MDGVQSASSDANICVTQFKPSLRDDIIVFND